MTYDVNYDVKRDAANDAFDVDATRAPLPLQWPLLNARSQLPALPPGVISRPRLTSILDNGYPAPIITINTSKDAGAERDVTSVVPARDAESLLDLNLLVEAPAGRGSDSDSDAEGARYPGDWYIWGPAGSGKSVLVRSWIESTGKSSRTAWLTLRPEDADPGRLLALLEAALLSEPDYPTYQQELDSGQPLSPEDKIWLLCRRLENRAEPVQLVLDQLESVYQLAVNQFLHRFIACAPSCLGIVLISRRPPSSSLEAMERLEILDPRDLALTLDETRQLVAKSAASIASDPMLEEIRRECDGWLQPVRLFATNANRYGSLVSSLADVPAIGRFIRERLLDGLHPGDQAGLFALADADLISDELAQALLAHSGSSSNLNRERLLELGIPIESASGQGAWFRLNGLLKTWLARQGQGNAPLGRGGANERRLFLSKWFARRGDSISAVHYAARAGDHEQALEIATACSESFLLSHNVDALVRLRPMLPAGAISSSARLSLVYAWVHAVRGQFGLSRAIIAEIPERESPAAARKFALEAFIACGEGHVDQAEASALRALAMESQLSPHAQVMIMLVLSSVARARSQFTQARDWNRKAGHCARHLVDYGCESLVVYDHARIELTKGNLDRAMQMLQTALEQSQLQAGQSPSAARSRLFLVQALIAWYRGEWELCDRLLGQGLPEAERVGDVAALLGLCIRALLCRARGNSHGAFVTIGQAERLMQYWKVDPAAYRPVLELLKISLWLECADRDRARSLLVLLETAETQPVPELFPALPGLQQVLIVRARLKAGDIDRGLDLLDVLQNQQRNQPPLAGQALYTMLLKVHAHQLKGAEDKALRLLRRTLDLAAEEDYISPVIELQQELAPLLRQLFSHGDDSAYYQRLRRRLTIDLRPAPAAPLSPGEVISDRELAVLELIAQGLSNQQIGDRLHISLHTVKTHARKINVKLGVRSRTQAIVRARELGYL